jgi:CubicO group peptidase (beta-lactamase class C family)
LIIEEVTGETFSAYMQREVLDPLGMVHSSFEWRAELRLATAVAYSETGAPLLNYLFTEQAEAGLYTTGPDLACFVAAEMPGPLGEPAGRGVLSPDTLTLMFTRVIQSQGLGQGVWKLPDGSELIQHEGANAGWRGVILAYPEWGVGVVVLTNGDKPGQRYQYNGARYGQLSQVVQAASGRSLQEWVYERILQPLGMENTAPSPPAACAGLPFAPTCERVYAALTRLYCLGVDFGPAPGYNGDYFNAGAGLMPAVVDLAKFDAALDANTLVTAATNTGRRK